MQAGSYTTDKNTKAAIFPPQYHISRPLCFWLMLQTPKPLRLPFQKTILDLRTSSAAANRMGELSADSYGQSPMPRVSLGHNAVAPWGAIRAPPGTPREQWCGLHRTFRPDARESRARPHSTRAPRLARGRRYDAVSTQPRFSPATLPTPRALAFARAFDLAAAHFWLAVLNATNRT